MKSILQAGYRSSWLWLVCAIAAPACAPLAAQAATETVLHNFASPPKGATPYAGVIRDSVGNLYGTSYNGGAAGLGAVYKVNTSGQLIVLHNFTGGTDGQNPHAGVVRDSAGNLYGTTYLGAAYNAGVVFRLAATGQETLLYTFTGGNDGGYPLGGVALDSAGNLYGTTELGGMSNGGVVFKLDTAGQETVLHSFGSGFDGIEPTAGVTLDSAGNVYGTTYYGGSQYDGVVFKVDAGGQESVLYNFPGGANGAYPWAGVIRDSAGNLYGTTSQAGAAGWGIVFKLDTTGHQTVLHAFRSGADGASPTAGVIRDASGNLYGTTYGGGSELRGVVFKLSAAGQSTILCTFTGPNGSNPNFAGVIRDSAGNTYGTTANGGPANIGVVFKLDTANHETLLTTFPGTVDGSNPSSGVVSDSAGNLYGSAPLGGASGWGTVYKLTPAGVETTLYTFSGGTDGAEPLGGVVRDSAGNLYGTTYGGGAHGYGAVYKLDTAGIQTVLYSFTDGPDGGYPYAGVILDSVDNLYGTTVYGGATNQGVVFKVDTAGTETTLYSFKGGLDGSNCYSGLLRDSAGNLYGTTENGGTAGVGVVFKVSTGGNESVMYAFTGGTDGAYPYSGLLRDSAGNLYGTTYGGGTGGSGTVYKVNSMGVETVLHNFTSTDGAKPYAGVIRDSAGNFYGTASQGGTDNMGVAYKLDSAGNYTTLYNFTGAGGSNPQAGLLRDSAGKLYGTTQSGGTGAAGVVFKLAP
jgi:uncharacterized repeat protein (TIGR03803 family)